MIATDAAQWIGDALPLLLVVILPFVRWAVRSGLDDKVKPLRESIGHLTDDLATLRRELRDHMRAEQDGNGDTKRDVRELRQALSTVQVQQATMIGQLTTIQQRGQQFRKDDE